MYQANCSWSAGMNNVDSQKYSWSIDGTQVANGSLQTGDTTRSSVQDGLTINPQDTVTFSVVSVNQWAESDPATATGTAPVPHPEAPSGVTMVFEEIVTQ